MQMPRNMKNQGNISAPKYNNSLLIIKLKGMEFCDLDDDEFKIAILKNSTAHKKAQKI